VFHTVVFQVVLLALTSTVLAHGLAASQFSHDVASPVTVMRAASEELDMLLDECSTSARPGTRGSGWPWPA
jgi:hypothetical protein